MVWNNVQKLPPPGECIQWNLSHLDTNGAGESVIVSEVSSFQRLKCMQEWYLGWEKVSCLERCPQFRSVLIEREVPLYTCVGTVCTLQVKKINEMKCDSVSVHCTISTAAEEWPRIRQRIQVIRSKENKLSNRCVSLHSILPFHGINSIPKTTSHTPIPWCKIPFQNLCNSILSYSGSTLPYPLTIVSIPFS